MDKIFDELKNKRKELGMSIEQICDITRLSPRIIRAIEDKDMAFFNNDLTYLKFYIKAYASAVNYDFNTIKKEFDVSYDEYTTSLNKKEIQEKHKINSDIKDKASTTTKAKPKMKTVKRKKRKFDFSLISLLVVIVLIVLFLLYSLYLFIDNGKNEAPQTNVPNVSEPTIPEESNPNKPLEPEQNKEVEIVKKDKNTYIIKNVSEKDKIKLDIEFVSSSWFSLKLNEVIQKDPISKTYDFGAKVSKEIEVSNDLIITVRFGFFLNNKVSVNGIEVPIDESLTSKKGADEIYLIFEGE